MAEAAKTKKARVTWTQHEETMIAMEIHRMRTGVVDRKWDTGREAVSLASMINLAAERVLPKHRHKSSAAVYTTKGNYGEPWYQTALARKDLYAPQEPPPAPAPAPVPQAIDDADPAKERVVEEPVDPELESMLVMGSLVQTFTSWLGGAITKGVKQALVELRNDEERKLRAEGVLAQDPPPMPTTAREIVKRKIDVIGLLPIQKNIVQKNPIARTWDIRFLHSGEDHGRGALRERVIICSKFVPHHQQNRYRQMKAEIHWANGGALSVIKELEKLSKLAPNGQAQMH